MTVNALATAPKTILKQLQEAVSWPPANAPPKIVPPNVPSVKGKTDISNRSNKGLPTMTLAPISFPTSARKTSTSEIRSSVSRMKSIVSTQNWVVHPCLHRLRLNDRHQVRLNNNPPSP